jgi:hypothetical protein
VKKTLLNDDEAQQLIDILLNKQSGDAMSSSEWTDAGKTGAGGSSVQKQLEAKTAALSEQEAALKSLTDRLNMLRLELNNTKSQANSAQRIIDEAQNRHQHEVDNLQTRLQVRRCMEYTLFIHSTDLLRKREN